MSSLRPDSLSLNLGLQVINPNLYGILINQGEFEILDPKEIFVSTGELREVARIKGRSSKNVDLILNLDTGRTKNGRSRVTFTGDHRPRKCSYQGIGIW